MTLTETITEELLGAVDRPGGLDEVMAKHAGSKGPLYAALAKATASLAQRLASTRDELKAAEDTRAARQKQLKELDGQVAASGKKRDALAKEVKELERNRERHSKSLTLVAELKARGFGEKELDRLAQMLGKIAASQGQPQGEGVAQFFKLVSRYEGVVSLELETQRAQVAASKARADAERWQAEAKRREATTKARLSVIETLERLLAKGVKELDLPHWSSILEKSGLSPEALAQKLEGYASLESLCGSLQQQAGKLQQQAKTLTAEVSALAAERQQLTAAIGAVRDNALAAMESTSQKALAAVQASSTQARSSLDSSAKALQGRIDALVAMAQEYGDLKRQVQELRGFVDLARAFKSAREDDWAKLSPEVVGTVVLGLTYWGQAADRQHRLASPPESLKKTYRVFSSDRASFSELMDWALELVIQEAASKLLQSGAA